MTLSLYDATVRGYIQTTAAVSAFLDRAAAHCQDNGVDPAALVETRLFPDMLPLRFQLVSVSHHSLGAIEGVKKGEFGPPNAPADLDFAGLQKLTADTLNALKALTPDEVNGLSGKDVIFKLGTFQLPFAAEGFLLSFSIPNFHFHATTAYDILRMKGVPLGKRDFMGPLRMKR